MTSVGKSRATTFPNNMCLDNRKHSLSGIDNTYLGFFSSLILRFHFEGSGISSLWRGPSHPRRHLPVPGAASLGLARSCLPPYWPPGFVQTGLGREPAEGKICEYGHKDFPIPGFGQSTQLRNFQLKSQTEGHRMEALRVQGFWCENQHPAGLNNYE